jgi:hypothetical protein
VENVRRPSELLATEKPAQMTDDDILQIYFQSDRPRRDSIVANEVDILQFARNIEAFLNAQKKTPEAGAEGDVR